MERMFDDLEGRLAHLESQEMRATAEDLARAERAQVPLPDRLRGALGTVIAVHLAPGLVSSGELTEVGEDWIGLGADGRRVLVPIPAIALLEGLPSKVRAAPRAVIPPPSLRQVLRGISRDRALVRVETPAGSATGRISAVGGDAFDLARRPTGERGALPRSGATGSVATVPLTAVRLIAVED